MKSIFAFVLVNLLGIAAFAATSMEAKSSSQLSEKQLTKMLHKSIQVADDLRWKLELEQIGESNSTIPEVPRDIPGDAAGKRQQLNLILNMIDDLQWKLDITESSNQQKREINRKSIQEIKQYLQIK